MHNSEKLFLFKDIVSAFKDTERKDRLIINIGGIYFIADTELLVAVLFTTLKTVDPLS